VKRNRLGHALELVTPGERPPELVGRGVLDLLRAQDAARAGDYRLEPAAAPEAFARADYQLEAEQARLRACLNTRA